MKTLCEVAPAFDTAAVHDLLHTLASRGLPPHAEIIYNARNRVARLSVDGKSMIIKEFCQPNIVNRYAYTTLRRSKARRSMEHATRLLREGFLTPEPVAWLECRRGLCLHLSYYICLEVKGKDLRFLDANPDFPELVDALGREMGLLHSAGVWHKDFSPGNVLYLRRGSDFEFYYIDLNRMQFGVHDPHRLLSNFRSLASADEVAAIARAYAPHSPFNLTPNQAESAARAARASFLRTHPGALMPGEQRNS